MPGGAIHPTYHPLTFLSNSTYFHNKKCRNLTNQLTCLLLPKFPIALLDRHTGRESWLRCWTSQHLALEFRNFLVKSGWKNDVVILLMVQKSGIHQLRLVVYPVIYRVLYIPGGAGFLNHKQYHHVNYWLVGDLRWWFGFRLDPQKWKGLGFLGGSQTTNLPACWHG